MALDTVTKITMAALKATIQAREPAMLVGAPGTGKTAMLRQVAKEMGYELITIIGSQMDPTDVTGLPKGEIIAHDDNGDPIWGTTYLSPHWQVRIMRHKKVFLLLDEFSNTPPTVRASFLTMLQNREFPNGQKMPKETVMVGAMNASEQATDGYELDLPTTNRLVFLSWSPSAASWYEGMLEAWGDDEVSDIEMHWRRRIVNFVQDNPAWLHREPANVDTSEIYGVNHNDANEVEVMNSAWASRRSWDKLSKILAFTPKEAAIQDKIGAGIVGYGAIHQFRDWLNKHDNIDPKKVLEKPSIVDWKNVDIGTSNLILGAITHELSAETIEKALELFIYVADQERASLGAPYLRDLIMKGNSKDVVGDKMVTKNKDAFRELVKKYRDVAAAHK